MNGSTLEQQPLNHTDQSKQIKQYILAAILALATVHSLGRFAFTPLLPYFISDELFSISQGADLATSNYLGYLLGALAAIFFSTPQQLKKFLLVSLVINTCMTIAQCFIADFQWVLLLRLLNGITNGIVFVLAPALVLEWLHEKGKSNLSGLVYFGVSGGLILSGILVSAFADMFHAQSRWIPIAIAAIPMTIYSLYYLAKIQLQPNPHLADKTKTEASTNTKTKTALFDRNSTPLFLAYIGAGLGYILPMTFLPTLSHSVLHEGSFIANNIWVITSLSSLIFTVFWNQIGAKFGDRFAISLSYWVQGFGVLAVLIFPNTFGILICAIFVGAGFLGSVMCTQRLARYFQPHQGPKLSAAMITIYAGAQLFGPGLAKWMMQNGASLTQSFLIGLIAFIWGIIWMFFVPKTKKVQ
ncbi:YbfB/YjiJ family MFS transporter [Acinetobacter gerneri]|uniref:Major facilitator superfamily (MFS) profile domain-containing protein n=1 Tax=Acinetobacter gerneri DSM 14967 = CIP 107464 = MTCC 9824 TaxID=1120926 RepID=N8Y833_9GAMM|nr:YbfB/YjiJ family MFS transporter [Acinetobacter gerneri]ENV32801.1 hypothetical protein F960_02976 [Acinetobacter gerneri DSM 14967 = CIP 107464 = MTCC 9824]EPR81698.1 putative transport protein (MFS superfamily) [Acinetobacter gerneri DSM 14967 = CIP 107464 = MTCC 9824]